MHIYDIEWGTSINNIVERINVIVFSSYLITFGTANLINTLKVNRTTKFIREWCLFRSDQTICSENEKDKQRYNKIRACLLTICISLIIGYTIVIVRYCFIFDWSMCGLFLFPSIKTSPVILKISCVYFHLLGYLSAFTVLLTACHFALVTLTLAEEFDKLYRVICNHVSSACTDVGPWEHIRFHHEALVSLVCLHSQLSSMLLGLIIVGNVVNLCFALYYFFAVQAGVLGVLTCTKGIVVLSTIIASSSILEKEVRKNFIKHDEEIAHILLTMSWIFPKNIYVHVFAEVSFSKWELVSSVQKMA